MPIPTDQRQIHELLAGESTERLLSQTMTALASGAAVEGLTLTRSKFKPERSLKASYDVDIAGRTWPILVTWHHGAADRSGTDGDLAADAIRAAAPCPFSALESYDDGLDASIKMWPFDPVFPQLPELVRRCSSNGREATVVRYRPGERHVLRIDQADSVEAEFVKLDRGHGDCQVKAALTAIDRAIAQGQVDPSVTSQLVGPNEAATTANGAPTYNEATGTVLSRLGDPELASQALGVIGRLAATIHSVDVADVVGLPSRHIDEELALVLRASEHVMYLAPDLAEPISQIIGDVAHHATGDGALRLVHGDLKLDHIFVSNGGVQLIDLDGFRLADPASDLAKLMAEFRFLQIDQQRPAMDRAEQQFAAGYCELGDPEIVERARRIEPALLIKMAARRISVVDQTWRARVGVVVEAASQLAAAASVRSTS